MNPYSYVRNNPVNFTDPSGFETYTQNCPDPNTNCTWVTVDQAAAEAAMAAAAASRAAADAVAQAQAQGLASLGAQATGYGAGYTPPWLETPGVPPLAVPGLPGDWSLLNGPGMPTDTSGWLAQSTHDEAVVERIEQYRDASSTPYEAWDRAREDYRLVRLKGGDPVLRDAEHFLFRYLLASTGGRFVVIPRNLTGVGRTSPWWDPPVLMNQGLMQYGHDPLYNTLRPILEHFAPITPTTPSMFLWESRGYDYGGLVAPPPAIPALYPSSFLYSF